MYENTGIAVRKQSEWVYENLRNPHSEQDGKKVYSYDTSGGIQSAGNEFNVSTLMWEQTPTSCVTGYSHCKDVVSPIGRVLEQDYCTCAPNDLLITQIDDPMGNYYQLGYGDAPPGPGQDTDLMGITHNGQLGLVPGWNFTYDTTNGNPNLVHDLRTISDPDLNTTGVTYDSLGRVSFESSATGENTLYAYANACQLCNSAPNTTQNTTITYPDGSVDFDRFQNDVLAESDIGSGSTSSVRWLYAPNNSDTAPAVATTDPAGNVTTTATDVFGNVTSVTEPNGKVAYTAYYPGTSLPGSDFICWTAPPTAPISPPPDCLHPAPGYTLYNYDTFGDLISKQDPLFNTTNYGYNTTNGELCWMANPGVPIIGATCSSPPSGSTVYGYDAYGNLTSQTDGAGHKTTWTYDLDSDLLTEVSPIGNEASPPIGGITAYTTTYTYYSAGQLESVKAPYIAFLFGVEFSTTSYTYDAVGNLLTRTDPDGYVTTTTYDADNRICWTAPGSYSSPGCGSPAGSGAPPSGATTYHYVANTANPATVTDGDGHVAQYFYYNPAYPGDVTRLVDGSGNQSSYVYDNDGNLCLSVPGLNVYQSGSNPDGTVPTCTWQGGATLNVYDALGQVTQSENPNGASTYTTYGDARFPTRPTQRMTPISTTSYVYDAVGHLLKQSTPNGATSYAYTNLGQVCDRIPSSTIPSVCPILPTTVGESELSYDGTTGNPSAIFDDTPSGISQTLYQFDANGEMLSISESDTVVNPNHSAEVDYYYDSGGQVICMAYPTKIIVNAHSKADCTLPAKGSNTIVDYGYDADSHMTVAVDWLGNQTSFNYTPPSSYQATPALANITYPASTGESINYTYDPSGFLTREAYAGPATGSTSTSWTPNGDDLRATQDSQTFGYNAQNQVTTGAGDSYLYNAAGAMTQDTPAGFGAIGLTPNTTTDELTQTTNGSTTTNFGYDAVGNRCNQRTTGTASCAPPSSSSTTYAWNSFGQLCWSGTGVTSDSCSTTPSGVTSYAYAGTGLRSSSKTGGSTQRYVWDEAGDTANPTLLMDGSNAYIYGPENFGGATAPIEQITMSGNSVNFVASDPTGVRTVFNSAGALQSSKSYNSFGKVTTGGSGTTTPFGFEGGYTDPSGLIYLLARYYDPSTNQFISVDPAVAVTDQPYAFSGDDPINLSDPTGLCWVCAVFHRVVHAVTKKARAFVHVVSKVVHTAAHFVRRHWKAIAVTVVVIVAVAVVSVGTGGLADAAIATSAAAEATGSAAAAAGVAASTGGGAIALATSTAADTAAEEAAVQEVAQVASDAVSQANGEAESALQDEAATNLDQLAKSGTNPLGGQGATKAGSSLEEHAGELGMAQPTGNAAAKAAAGQNLLEDILTDPATATSPILGGNFAGGTYFINGEGIGAAFDPGGTFQYFGYFGSFGG